MWQEPQDFISSTERGRTDLTTFYSMEKCSHVCQLHKNFIALALQSSRHQLGQHCLGATRAALCSGHSEQHSLQQDGRMDMAVVQLAFILLSSNPRLVTPTAMHLNGSKLPNSCFQCCKLNLKSSPNQLQQVVQKEATPALAWSILMWGYYEEGNMAEEVNCSLEYGAQK